MNNIFEKSLRLLPDKLYLQLLYFKHFKKFINFKNPKTFNEKLQWLKLYDRKPIYTTLVDKYLVKEFVQNNIGRDFIIPTLGVWDTVDEIDFDSLPNQFVLKWNHDSGSVVICKEKSSFNIDLAKQQLSHGAKFNGYWYGREWPYKNVKEKIIAETYLPSDNNGDLIDYKLMCFNGKVKCICTCVNRHLDGGLRVIFYDLNWNVIFSRDYPIDKYVIPRPFSLDKMIIAAEKLSKDIPFARIDFYEIDKKPLFGEITFYPASGIKPFKPESWDLTMGEWLTI